MEELLVYLSCLYQGDFRKIKQAIETGETYSVNQINNCLNHLNCRYTTLLSADYPKKLFDLKEPPWVLFYMGDLSLASEAAISIVGMREPSEYGRKMAQYFSQTLSDYFVVVSGLAKGIDGVAHRFAKKTIAVLGCGIDICYPKQHAFLYQQVAKCGLLISEFPPGIAPRKYFFPWRNRLIAALGDSLLVVEAKPRSGSMITVGHALELGKPIFAVPCRIGDHSGTLSLIRDGAYMAAGVQDIAEILNFSLLRSK